MPLVEFALTRALERARSRAQSVLTRAALAKVGGIEGALERHAEATIAAMERANERLESTSRGASCSRSRRPKGRGA